LGERHGRSLEEIFSSFRGKLSPGVCAGKREVDGGIALLELLDTWLSDIV